MGVTINNEATTTEPPPKNGHLPKPPEGLNAFRWNQTFSVDSVVVKAQRVVYLAWRLPNYSNAIRRTNSCDLDQRRVSLFIKLWLNPPFRFEFI